MGRASSNLKHGKFSEWPHGLMIKISCEPRKKKLITFHGILIFHIDPYFTVYEIIPIIYWAGFHPRKKSPKQPVVYPKWKLDSPKKSYICTNRLGLGLFFRFGKNKSPENLPRCLCLCFDLGWCLGCTWLLLDEFLRGFLLDETFPLVISFKVWIYVYLEPVCPLFWCLNPPKEGPFQAKQGSFRLQVYIYIYIYIDFL